MRHARGLGDAVSFSLEDAGGGRYAVARAAGLQTPAELSYIMGNPPFVGAKFMDDQQRQDVAVVFGNIKKYLMYLLSSNIGEIGLIAGSALLGLPLPLTAVQILYVNLATDGLPALALSIDPAEKDLMKRKPRNQKTGIFTRPVVALMLAGGIWSTIINLGLFIWAMNSGRSLEESMTMTFVSLVLVQFFKAYNFRSDRHSIFNRPFENKWLNTAILWEAVLLLLIVYVPALHEPFNTFSLPLIDWAIIGVLSLTISPVLELVKWMTRKGWFGVMDA